MFDTLGFILTLFNVFIFIWLLVIGVVYLIGNYKKPHTWFLPPAALLFSLGLGLFSLWLYNNLTL